MLCPLYTLNPQNHLKGWPPFLQERRKWGLRKAKQLVQGTDREMLEPGTLFIQEAPLCSLGAPPHQPTLSPENTTSPKPWLGVRNWPPVPQVLGCVSLSPASHGLCASSFNFPVRPPQQIPPALNSTLGDLQTLQGHQNKAISCASSFSSQSKLFCLTLRQLSD